MSVTINRLNHSKKIFSYSNWEFMKSILDGTMKQKFSPILTLDPTEKCNYFCEYCIDAKNTNKINAQSLEWNWLQKILRETRIMGCRGIEITGGGEPTLYEHFEDLILLATELGFRLALITNGSMLYKYIESINNSSFDWIRVSLDAATATTHQLVHSIDCSVFDKIINAIKQISYNKVIGISFIISGKNYKEVYLATCLAKEIGAKYIEFKPKINEDKKFDTEFDVESVSKQLEKCKRIEQPDFHVILTQSLQGILNSEALVYPKQNKQFHQCYYCYLKTVLTPSGVYPCPYKRGSNFRINKIENAQDILKARNSLISFMEPSKICNEYCALSTTNYVIDKLIGLPKEFDFLIDSMRWPIDYGDDWFWF